MAKFTEIEDLKQQTHRLSEIRKENTFRVPEDYFEELPGNIQSLCQEIKQKLPWRKKLIYKIFTPPYLIAAGVLILMISLVVFVLIENLPGKKMDNITLAYQKSVNNLNKKFVKDTVTTDSTETVIQTNIKSKINSTTVSQVNTILEIENASLDELNISAEDVIDYLNDEEDIDNDLLMD
jgi:hypothetical protein